MKGILKFISDIFVKSTMGALDRQIKNDSEVQEALEDFFDNRAKTQLKIRGFCERHPDSDLCNNKVQEEIKRKEKELRESLGVLDRHSKNDSKVQEALEKWYYSDEYQKSLKKEKKR